MRVHTLDRIAGDGVVAGKSVKGTLVTDRLSWLRDLNLLDARVAGASIWPDVEAAPAVVDTVGAGAGHHGVLQTLLVRPALQVVAV